jgi:hypothetical protein
MEIGEAISVSKINTNKDCAWKLCLTYHIKHPDLRKPTIYTEKGVAVHEVLELYAKGDKDYLGNLLKYYQRSKLWELDQRSPDKGGFPHPQPKTCEACLYNKGGVCGIAEAPIENVNGCPRPNFEDDLALAEKVIAREGDDNLFARKILGAEIEFLVEIGGAKVRGVIDLVTELDENTLEIIDYKTGRHAQTSATIQKDPQCRIYNLVAKMLWPQYKFRLVTLDYLRKKPITVTFSDEDDELTILSVKRQDQDMRTNVDPAPLSRPSWLCRFCIGHERCNEMYDSLKDKKGKFKLPVISCDYANPGELTEKILLITNGPCWGGMSCINDNPSEINDLKKLRYACEGHKEISRGGVYRPKEEKKEEVKLDLAPEELPGSD